MIWHCESKHIVLCRTNNPWRVTLVDVGNEGNWGGARVCRKGGGSWARRDGVTEMLTLRYGSKSVSPCVELEFWIEFQIHCISGTLFFFFLSLTLTKKTLVWKKKSVRTNLVRKNKVRKNSVWKFIFFYSYISDTYFLQNYEKKWCEKIWCEKIHYEKDLASGWPETSSRVNHHHPASQIILDWPSDTDPRSANRKRKRRRSRRSKLMLTSSSDVVSVFTLSAVSSWNVAMHISCILYTCSC